MILKVTSGPKAGLTSPVLDGLSLGRKKTQVALEDPKSSNLHAIIEKQGDQYILVDQKSRNGIKFHDKKVERLIIEPGIEFVIGNSVIKIEASVASKKKAAPVEDPQPSTKSVNMEHFEFKPSHNKPEPKPSVSAEPDLSPQPQQPLPEESLHSIDIEPAHWSEVIKNFVEDHQEVLKDKNKPVQAFKDPVYVKILRGIQAGKSWTLGYGPRFAGKSSLDMQIFDQDAVDICFELVPSEKGCVFKTSHPNKVLLDGKKQKSKVLEGGEIITIGITELEVGFIYE